MGIMIDIVLILIILVSAFLGYKKGLVKLGTRLFAGIIAIILTLIIYRPISNIIINNTSIDEKIEQTIIQNTTNFINENSQISNNITNQVKDEVLPEGSKNISKNIIYTITSLVLFIVIKIILSILISLLDFVANLPILKQFNEAGGIIYGLLRGALIVCIFVLIVGIITKINKENILNKYIKNSYVTKMIYENIVKF